MDTHPYIIEIPQSAIENALRAAGIEGVTLYEVPEKAVKEMADLTDTDKDRFNWQSVWAAAEVATEDFHRVLQALCEEAVRFGRFPHFIAAVRMAVIEETEPGRTAIVFRGFQWDPSAEGAEPEYPFDNDSADALPES